MKPVNVTFLLICTLFWFQKATGQRLKHVMVDADTIRYFHTPDTKTQLPNWPIQLVVVKNPLQERFYWYQEKLAAVQNNEKWHQVFVGTDEVLQGENPLKTLERLLDELFYILYFDRNRVHVVIEEDISLSDVGKHQKFITTLASVCITSNSMATYTGNAHNIHNLDEAAFGTILQKSTSVTAFEPVTIKGKNALQKKKEQLNARKHIKNNHFLTLTGGYYQVDGKNATAFDEETLVNLRDYKTLWTLSYSYMIGNKWGLVADLGFIAKQSTSSTTISTATGVTFSGEGSGVGILKTAIGGRLILFKTLDLHLFTDILGGRLRTKIGGGGGGITITENGVSSTIDRNEKEQTTLYFDGKLGLNYRLGNRFLLHGDLLFTTSNFSEAIGSVTGFTGGGVNLGIGFVF
ncbi:MAG: hypothetical protein AAGF96_04780 [Bacteroidota bacterium]